MSKILFVLVCSVQFVLASPQRHFPEETKNYKPYTDNKIGVYKALDLRKNRQIVLTFDDGPHPTRTPRLLDLLGRYNIKATFFVLGEHMHSTTQKRILSRILREGHILASHDYTHDNNNSESEYVFIKDLEKSIDLIKELEKEIGIYQEGIYFRFPYGAYGNNSSYHHINVLRALSSDLFGENCINFAFWDIDTSDWVANMTAQNVSDNIWANIDGGTAYSFVKNSNGKYIKKPYQTSGIGGGVILMHDIHERTIQGVEIFLREWSQNNRGVEIVPLTQARDYNYSDRDCSRYNKY